MKLRKSIMDKIYWFQNGRGPQVNASEDYGLHVYTYDGRNVGLNYITGEYENNMENVTTSGNISSGAFPILKKSCYGVKYMVKNKKKKLAVGERMYITEATVKGEGVSEILKTSSKFTITAKGRPGDHHEEDQE